MLNPVGTPFRVWATALATSAAEPARTAQLPYWRGVLATREAPLGQGEGSAARTTVELAPDLAEPLLTSVPAALGVQARDVLLTALAIAVADVRRTGDTVLLELEGHGRADLVPGADLTRTVGWFTSLFPVRLDLGAREGGEAALVRSVAGQLAEVPENGAGYGLLRHLNPVTAPVLAAMPPPQVRFNYLGRLDAGTVDGWSAAPEEEVVRAVGNDDHPVPRGVSVDVAAVRRADGEHLRADLTWRTGALTADAVDRLAARWRRALTAIADQAVAVRPGEAPLVHLSQDELDELEADWGSRT